MKRTLGFLLGLILRVVLSAVVALWASSGLFVIIADLGIQGVPGIKGVGLMSNQQGILFSVLDNAQLSNGVRLLNADDPNAPGNWAVFTGPSRHYGSLLGVHVWLRSRMAPFQVASNFPAAVVVLIGLYWFSRRLGRVRPGRK